MKVRIVAINLILVCMAGMAYAVPPAYEGPFGNPEEPALRVIKWPWLGLRKMVMHTHDGLNQGIQCSPVAAMKEGACGAKYGSCILIDHVGRGLIYSKLPPKASLRETTTYEEQALAYIEKVTASGEESIHKPAVDSSSQAPKQVDEHGNAYLVPKRKESDKSIAQRRYVPERVKQRDRALARRTNLLRLVE